jgi:carbamoyltransferase
VDNKLVAAAEEERFVRKKHYSAFPYNSLDFCLRQSGLDISEIDYFCFNFNRSYNFYEKLKFLIKNPKLIKISKSRMEKEKHTLKLLSELNVPSHKIKFIPHHKAHMASSFFFSGHDEAVTFSFDGTGDFSTIEIFMCKKKDIKLLEKLNFPNSLGLFYQMITQYLGFKKYGDEYKVMSLASYGKKTLVEKLSKNF